MWGFATSDSARPRQRFIHPEAARWMRPDAERWIRPDIARFLAAGSRPADVVPALNYKYNPNQPRVPAGNPDGGQWTHGGGGGNSSSLDDRTGHDDPRVLSDADPEVVKPGQQYTQVRGRRGGGIILINGQQFDLTLGQQARLILEQSRAQAAIARVREVNPSWSPPKSAYQSPEGLIRAYEADSVAAQARLTELAAKGAIPGPYRGESLPARGAGHNFTAAERSEINRIGRETGCHTCGTLDPGSKSGNFYIDHQFPNAINQAGRAQRLFPQCRSCSLRQGPFVRDLKRSR
ncbi:hypothetical protein LOC51_20870 [Rubrivivax sp. JA1024]|nr:hypothetical protein [Rubrivivax sp. JA1024]